MSPLDPQRLSIITIETVEGPLDRMGEIVCEELFAIHLTSSSDLFVAPLTLTHLPTGRALVRGHEPELLRRVAKTLVKLMPMSVLELSDHEQVEAQTPQHIAEWLKRCHRDGWAEPPKVNGRVHAEAQAGKQPQPPKDRLSRATGKHRRSEAQADRRARACPEKGARREDQTSGRTRDDEAAPAEVESGLTNAARTPHRRMKMAKQKTFKAGPAAQKVVRQLVQSMTPENRKAFHEGLRVATKENITTALQAAFDAGKGGCLFSKD